MKKKTYPIFLFILLVLFNGCSGYKPIFSASNLEFIIDDYSISGNKKLGNQIYSKLYNLSKSSKNNAEVQNVNITVDTTKDKKATAKDSAGKILEYKINLNTKIKITDFITGKKLLEQDFNSSLNYKIQDQYSDTIKLENQTIENLLNKTLQEILINLSRNISS